MEEISTTTKANTPGKKQQDESEDNPNTVFFKSLPPPTIHSFVQFSHLGFTVDGVTRMHGLTGKIPPGQFLALMGPSGSGKSTLLKLLSGRQNPTEGDLVVNNKPASHSLSSQVGYVSQDQFLFPSLTVERTLMYCGLLRLPNLTREEVKTKVDEMIKAFGIERCRDTLVANLSGGEARRVAICSELFSGPSILVLDEPFSGLDLNSALHVMLLLKAMTKKGYSVVCSIHQPSSRMFSLFDALVIVIDGNIVYSGPAQDSILYFNKIGYKCPPHTNPADFIMDLTLQAQQSGQVDFGGLLLKHWQQFTKGKDISKPNALEKRILAKCEREEAKSTNALAASSWTWQFYVLLQREFFKQKAVMLNIREIGQTILVSVLVGLAFLQMPREAERVRDMMNAIYLICFYIGTFYPIFKWAFMWQPERTIVLHEWKSQSYTLSAFYVASTLAHLPYSFIHPLLGSIITYWMIGIRDEASYFFLFCFALWLGYYNGMMAGRTISFICSPDLVATASVAMFFNVYMVVVGFLVLNWPVWMEWSKWLTYGYPTLRACFFIAFGDDPNTAWTSSESGFNDYSTNELVYGDDILAYLNVNSPLVLWSYLLLVFGWLIFSFIVGGVSLSYWQPKRR
eukprot:TRINITY_DN9683_c0_g1_i1.p1 TRINITY_DN9683_c0_g1~~TRINITY_DN9683_c0_g1_i1.p1  ORF type:complete len:635 (-),score=101.41 TRINITY_DN9683_c0_g1_i1:82-1956(-)